MADCIDTVSGKLEIIQRARDCGVSVISALGTGNKLCPELLRLGDIAETEVCPLARVMRRELKVRGMSHLKVVWSPEEPKTPIGRPVGESGKPIPASTPFVPPVAGILLARTVVCDLLGIEGCTPYAPH